MARRRAVATVVVPAGLLWVCSWGALGQEAPESGTGQRPDPAGTIPEPAPVFDTIPLAPDPALPVAQADSPAMLDEVIVTAERKTASTQETPISLTTFRADRLEKDGVGNLMDIGSSVPSMTIEPFPISNTTLRIFIRGIGLNDAQITQDAPVGVYLDGAYIARSTGLALDLAELERIEVLRGPQGTLYGRNATGGAINLITKRPLPGVLGLTQTLKAGDFGLLTSKTNINVPLGSTAAVKLAYLVSSKDGFVENDGPGGEFGDRSDTGLRVDLGWNLPEGLRLDYGYDDASIRFHTHTYQPVTPRPFVPPDPSDPQGAITAQLNNSAQQFVTHSSGRWSRARTAEALQPSDTDISGHTLTLDWATQWAVTVKYIGALRELHDVTYADLGGGGGHPEYRLDYSSYLSQDGSTLFPASIPVLDHKQSSHELQFTGLLFDDRVDYLAGLYFFEEDAVNSRPLGHQLNAPLSRDESVPGTTTETSLLNLVGQDFEINNEAKAVFARATWTPPWWDDRVHLTLGGRHSRDDRAASKTQETRNLTETTTTTGGTTTAGPPTPLNGTSFASAASRSFSDSSFDFVGEWEAGRAANVYAKYGEAYKSGGFNVRDPNPARFNAGFGPEKVRSIELGIKSEWFGRRLRVNGDVFTSDYRDVQLNFLLPNSIADTQVVNAGEARMDGLELDVTLLALRELVFAASYAYLDARITGATDPDTGADVTGAFSFASAPEQSWTAIADYTVGRWGWGRLNGYLSWSYMGARNGSTRSESVPATYLPPYQLINARVGIYDIPVFGGVLTTALWGKNLADKEYVINAIDNLPHALRSAMWGDPRSFGLDLIFHY